MLKAQATIHEQLSAIQSAFAAPQSGPRTEPTAPLGRTRTPGEAIPVARPLLPDFDAVSPYIAAIDRNRFYSNFGPLVRELEGRLAELLSARGGRDCGALTVANGTMGLVAALQAQDPPAGRYCLVPSWTFAASAHAVLMAGLVPYFVDVDPDSGQLTPEIAGDALGRLRHEVAAVMPVAPHGAPLDVEAWDAFQRDTGLAVAIDAAAAFDTVHPGRVPAVVSLHATKVLAAGEGGFITATDVDLLRRVQRVSNFGFDGSRIPTTAATNAKMSEYHAAVALASLDGWAGTRARFLAVAAGYLDALKAYPDVVLADGLGEGWTGSTLVASLPEAAREAAVAALDADGIGHRLWWGDGCHATPAFRTFPRDPLPATQRLAAGTLGLPFYQDMTRAEIGIVSALVGEAVRSHTPRPTAGAANPQQDAS